MDSSVGNIVESITTESNVVNNVIESQSDNSTVPVNTVLDNIPVIMNEIVVSQTNDFTIPVNTVVDNIPVITDNTVNQSDNSTGPVNAIPVDTTVTDEQLAKELDDQLNQTTVIQNDELLANELNALAALQEEKEKNDELMARMLAQCIEEENKFNTVIDDNVCVLDPATTILSYKCPNCSCITTTLLSELACCIFRHGYHKQSGTQISPHESKDNCDRFRASGEYVGCCEPFKIEINNGKYTVHKCDYI